MGAKKAVDQEFLSTGTIARKLNVSLDTIRREIYAGRLKASRFNDRSYIVSVSDFEMWKAKHLTPVIDV